MGTLKGRPSARPLRLTVGVADSLPKVLVQRLLEPAFHIGHPIQLICREDRVVEDFLGVLAVQDLDLVLADRPLGPGIQVQAFRQNARRPGRRVALERHRQEPLVIAAQLGDRVDVRVVRRVELLGDVQHRRVVEQRARQPVLDRMQLASAHRGEPVPAWPLRIRRQARRVSSPGRVEARDHRIRPVHPGGPGNENRIRVRRQHIFRAERAPRALDTAGGDVVRADQVQHPAPHALPIGIADHVGAALAEFDIDFRL